MSAEADGGRETGDGGLGSERRVPGIKRGEDKAKETEERREPRAESRE
jgi:hypothetical protein